MAAAVSAGFDAATGGNFDLPLQTTPSGIRAGCALSAFGRHFRDGGEQEVPLVTESEQYRRLYRYLGWERENLGWSCLASLEPKGGHDPADIYLVPTST